eukprot:2750684-Pleurochrysis_carterae.AAC.1
MEESALAEMVAEIDLDNNGTLEFIELIELLRKVGSRAKEMLREQTEAGARAIATRPLLHEML